MKKFEKFINESFNSHLKIARKINEQKEKPKEFYRKFLFIDFDNTLFDNETQSIIESKPYHTLVECLESPEPCYICIVTARRSDTKEFVKEKITSSVEDLLQDFKGIFKIETVLDKSPESKPGIYETAMLKVNCINSIIKENVENLQDNILVYFFDDTEENVEMVAKSLDYLNILTDNCHLV